MILETLDSCYVYSKIHVSTQFRRLSNYLCFNSNTQIVLSSNGLPLSTQYDLKFAVYKHCLFAESNERRDGTCIVSHLWNFGSGTIFRGNLARDVYFGNTAKILNIAHRNSQVQFQSLLSLAWSAINLFNTISNILFILKSHFQNNMFLASHLTKQHNIVPDKAVSSI